MTYGRGDSRLLSFPATRWRTFTEGPGGGGLGGGGGSGEVNTWLREYWSELPVLMYVCVDGVISFSQICVSRWWKGLFCALLFKRFLPATNHVSNHGNNAVYVRRAC